MLSFTTAYCVTCCHTVRHSCTRNMPLRSLRNAGHFRLHNCTATPRCCFSPPLFDIFADITAAFALRRCLMPPRLLRPLFFRHDTVTPYAIEQIKALFFFFIAAIVLLPCRFLSFFQLPLSLSPLMPLIYLISLRFRITRYHCFSRFLRAIIAFSLFAVYARLPCHALY